MAVLDINEYLDDPPVEEEEEETWQCKNCEEDFPESSEQWTDIQGNNWCYECHEGQGYCESCEEICGFGCSWETDSQGNCESCSAEDDGVGEGLVELTAAQERKSVRSGTDVRLPSGAVYKRTNQSLPSLDKTHPEIHAQWMEKVDEIMGMYWVDVWTQAARSRMIPLDGWAADFYLLEAIVAGAFAPQSDHPMTRVSLADGMARTQAQAAKMQAKLVAELDPILVEYTDMAIGGELRHMTRFPHRIIGGSRGGAWHRWWALAQIMDPEERLALAEEAFLDSGNDGVGSLTWATVASVLKMRYAGAFSPALFIDRIFNMVHNGGPILNKSTWGSHEGNPLDAIRLKIGPAHSAAGPAHSNPWKVLCRYSTIPVTKLVRQHVEAIDKVMQSAGVTWSKPNLDSLSIIEEAIKNQQSSVTIHYVIYQAWTPERPLVRQHSCLFDHDGQLVHNYNHHTNLGRDYPHDDGSFPPYSWQAYLRDEIQTQGHLGPVHLVHQGNWLILSNGISTQATSLDLDLVKMCQVWREEGDKELKRWLRAQIPKRTISDNDVFSHAAASVPVYQTSMSSPNF